MPSTRTHFPVASLSANAPVTAGVMQVINEQNFQLFIAYSSAVDLLLSHF